MNIFEEATIEKIDKRREKLRKRLIRELLIEDPISWYRYYDELSWWSEYWGDYEWQGREENGNC